MSAGLVLLGFLLAAVPAKAQQVVQLNGIVGIFSQTGQYRLDIGTDAVKQNVPASHESWATRLRITRLSGPNVGPVTYEDVVGIFSEDGKFRLDIGTDAMKKNVAADHDSWATRLRIKPR
jgi:phosphotransferase system IIB component